MVLYKHNKIVLCILFFSIYTNYALYDLEQFKSHLHAIGELAKRWGQRLTFHPGQYNQLTSLRETVVDNAVIDIDFHAKLLDYMGLDKQSVIIIHGGSKQEGQQAGMQRFEANVIKLSVSSRQRLVLENCEMAYAIEDLLPTCEKLAIPLVIDYHHHAINPGTQHLDDLTEQVLEIWHNRGITPLFHVSQSKTGVAPTDSVTARRAHSDYVECLPAALLVLLQTHEIHVDIEAKMKEQAVFALFTKYDLATVDLKVFWNLI